MPNERTDDPVRDPPPTARPVRTDGGPLVGGVLLAAGRSTRFEGGNKLLASVDGDPVVRRAARTLVDSGLDGAVAVLGHRAADVETALAGLDVSTTVNEDYADGQSTSVAAGVAVARDRGWDAVVFALGDMPFVSPATVDALLAAYRDGEGAVLAPAHDGRRGNPTLFDARYFDDLVAVRGDRGGRDIVASDGTLVDVPDPGIHEDVDRENDLPDR